MPRLIWTPRALDDVQRLYRFLLPKDPDAARRAAAAIRNGVRILAEHPRVGQPMEDMAPEFRRWPIDFGNSGYVVLYRLEADEVILLAVRHRREAGFRQDS